MTGTVAGAEFVMLSPDRCEIAKELYWGSGQRPDPADALALELVVALCADATTFLDVGSYTGIFTLAVASGQPHVQVHAFEMVPPVLQVLHRNVQRNGVQDRVDVHETGVGDPAATMIVPTEDTGSALPSFYSSQMAFDTGTKVGFTALDAVDVPGPVVVKLDVEGGEQQLLEHGQRFVAEHRPDILCEVLPDADGPALTRLVAEHGLGCYTVGADGLQRRESIEPSPDVRDWLLTARDPQALRALGYTVRA